MGCCCLPPDRVKLAVNSKKETNSRVKMGKGSRWASVIYPLKESKWSCCCLPPDRVKLIVNSKKETNSRVKIGRVKMGQGSRWASVLTPDRAKLTEQQERNKGYGQIGPKGVKLGLAHFGSETIESNWGKRSQVGPGPF